MAQIEDKGGQNLYYGEAIIFPNLGMSPHVLNNYDPFNDLDFPTIILFNNYGLWEYGLGMTRAKSPCAKFVHPSILFLRPTQPNKHPTFCMNKSNLVSNQLNSTIILSYQVL